MTGKMSKKAYVFGAGVAGLTAAHELAERGFEVIVVEAEPDPRNRSRPLVGGLAATQWERLPAPSDQDNVKNTKVWYREKMRPTMKMEGARVGEERLDGEGADLLRPSAFPGGDATFGASDSKRRRERIQRVASVLRSYVKWSEGSAMEEVWIGATELANRPDAFGAVATAQEVADRLIEALFGGAFIPGHTTSDWKVLVNKNDTEKAEKLLDIEGYGRIRFVAANLGRFVQEEYPAIRDVRAVVVRLSEQIVPGEHGYRFFPSFYLNVFDTMRKIPLLKYKQNRRGAMEGFKDDFPAVGEFYRSVEPESLTVFDNLVSIERHVLASSVAAPIELERTQIPSVGALRRLLDASQGVLGFSSNDLLIGQLALLKFLLSSEPRRRLLERQSWSEYANANLGSSEYRESLRRWPQALVGLRGGDADARAFGTAAVQLALDQLKPGDLRDASLAGPTTSMWFDPWRDYLSSFFGVKFVLGELVSLEWSGSKISVGYTDFNRPDEPRLGDGGDPRGKPATIWSVDEDAYVVFALPLVPMVTLASALGNDILEKSGVRSGRLNDALGASENAGLRAFGSSPFMALASFGENWSRKPDAEKTQCESWTKPMLGEAKLLAKDVGGGGVFRTEDFAEDHDPAPLRSGSVTDGRSSLRHFAGIQFFLEEDFAGARGHIYYTDSPWGLSSVSPVQYRRERPDGSSLWQGMVSAIVGIWDVPGILHKKLPCDCDRQEFAEEVWAQIRMAFRASPNPAPERPLAYHIDEGLQRRSDTREWQNNTPFLTNVVGLADWWPEEPGRYQVYFDRVVFCGTWLRTWTRLVTMEAANESARHAVNAILEDYAVHGQDPHSIAGCMVSNPEEHEIEDLGWFKRLDAELCARNLPHLFEILGIDAAVLGKAGDGRGGVIQAITEHVRTSGELGRGVADALTRTLATLFERYGLG